MTKRMTTIFYIVMASLLFFSCKKDLTTLDMNNITTNGTVSIKNADWTGLDVTSGKTTDFMTYTVSPTNTGVPIAMEYAVEMDLKSNNFSNPITIASVLSESFKESTTIAIPVSIVNSILLGTYLPSIGDKMEISLRERWNPAITKNTAGDTLTKIIGDYTVGGIYNDPAAAPVSSFPPLCLPGGFAYGTSWEPGTSANGRKIYSLKSDKVYMGFTYIANQFKFSDATKAGDWSSNYGDGSHSGLLASNGADIGLPSNGFYFLTANINALTYECVPFTAFNIIINGGAPIPMTESQGAYTNSVSDTYGNQWTTTQTLQSTDKIQFQISGVGVISGTTQTFTLGQASDTKNGATSLKQDGDVFAVGVSGSKTIVLDLRAGLYRCVIR